MVVDEAAMVVVVVVVDEAAMVVVVVEDEEPKPQPSATTPARSTAISLSSPRLEAAHPMRDLTAASSHHEDAHEWQPRGDRGHPRLNPANATSMHRLLRLVHLEPGQGRFAGDATTAPPCQPP